jgi:hypothetical protein
MEAFINEFHLDVEDNSLSVLGNAGRVAHIIRELWFTVDRRGILDKYQWVLTISESPSLDKSAPTYRMAADLVALRNYLVHYKPEWDDNPHTNVSLENRLSGKFELNPLSVPSQLFVPHRVLGYGSGAWAVRSARTLIKSFCSSLGCRDKLAGFDSEMQSTLSGVPPESVK